MAEYALIFYSHSDYSDAWVPMFEQTNRYFPDHKKYLFSDQSTKELEQENWQLIKYDDRKGYQNRVIDCLDQVEEDIVMFHHEDMFLYGEPRYDQLSDIASVIKKGNIDIVKLICASYKPIEFENIKSTELSYIFENPPNLKFAIQPSLCNKSKLRMIYHKTGGDSIWKFEAHSSHVCDYLDIRTGMTFFETDQKRGKYHWDSSIYPYFATAIVKGKWNFAEYEDILRPILEQNNVDYLNRGVC